MTRWPKPTAKLHKRSNNIQPKTEPLIYSPSLQHCLSRLCEWFSKRSIVKLQLSLLVQLSSNYSNPIEINQYQHQNTTIRVRLYTLAQFTWMKITKICVGEFLDHSVFTSSIFWQRMHQTGAAPEYFSRRQPAKASNAMLGWEKIRFRNTGGFIQLWN